MPRTYTHASHVRCTIACSDDSPEVGGLDAQERREYAEQPHNARRGDWLAGRLAAKRAIAAHCEVSKARVRLVGTIRCRSGRDAAERRRELERLAALALDLTSRRPWTRGGR